MKSRFTTLSTRASIATIAIAMSASAFAQTQTAPAEENTGIADIVVTAQKREQRLQDVPVAITALTTDVLTTNRITSVRDLDSISPNLTVRQIVGGGQLPSYSMRGVVTIGSSIGVDRGVAVYVDGVFLGNAQGQVFELGDIQRIEVLRGPQGTLFGRNATGGAISITSGDPKGEFGMRGTVGYGNYNQFRGVAHLDTPSFGDFSASFNYVHTQRKGDIKNLGAGTTWNFTSVGAGIYKSPKTLGGFNTDAGSANLLYDGEKLRAIYKADFSDTVLTSNGQGVIYASPFIQALYAAQPAANQALLTPVSHTRPDAVNNGGAVPSHIKTQGHNLTLSGDITDNLSVKNIAAFRKSSFRAPMSQIDGLGGLINPGTAAMGVYGPAFGAVGGGAALVNANIGAPFLLQSTVTRGEDKQWSDELQFNFTSDPVTITAGGLYFRQTATRGSIGTAGVGLAKARSVAFQFYPNFNVPGVRSIGYGAIDGHVKVISKAVFGQAEFHVLDNLDLIAGGRYTDDKKVGIDNTIVSAGLPASPTTSFPINYKKGKFTYNLGFNYKATSDVLLYGKYVTGFISGGFFASQAFAPEIAKSWEGGVKADWFGRKLRTNLSLFTVKYTDLQLTTSGVNIGLSSAISQVVVNAGDARAKGFELETTIQPIRALTFNASLGYVDFKYTRLDPRVVTPVFAFLVHERPKWTSSLSAQYESDPLWGDATFVARIDGNYKSKHNANATIPLTSATFGITAAEQQRVIDAQKVKGYWLVNGRLAIQKIDLGGSKATVALWGRNLFDAKEISYSPSLVHTISADYERARTYGVDLTVEF